MKDSIECYHILGLEPGCSPDRIREAYLQLSRFYDPERHEGEPEHQKTAKQKRDEVEVAYQSLRRFLPQLQGPPGSQEKAVRITRDFKEMEVQKPLEKSRAVMGIIVAVVFVFMFALAIFLVVKSERIKPPPSPSPTSIE
jgi:hypothetical protein